ncbi:MAG TPA: hypothetical protein VN764_02465, partial [Polyangiaceae bacterium]|nr:hypothetical protein [Polyangiaceae bacterium]
MRKRPFLASGLFTVAALIMAGGGACSADPPTRDETDGVITVETDTYNAPRYGTFVLNRELDELCTQSKSAPADEPAEDGEAECVEIDHSHDEAILDRLAKNMKALGLDQLSTADASDADLYLVAGGVTADFWNMSKDFCIDNGSLKGCLASITDQELMVPSGSLILALVDQTASNDGELEVVWAASIDQRVAAGRSLAGSAGGAGGAAGAFDLDPWLD